jgi:hypothetical protein
MSHCLETGLAKWTVPKWFPTSRHSLRSAPTSLLSAFNRTKAPLIQRVLSMVRQSEDISRIGLPIVMQKAIKLLFLSVVSYGSCAVSANQGRRQVVKLWEKKALSKDSHEPRGLRRFLHSSHRVLVYLPLASSRKAAFGDLSLANKRDLILDHASRT